MRKIHKIEREDLTCVDLMNIADAYSRECPEFFNITYNGVKCGEMVFAKSIGMGCCFMGDAPLWIKGKYPGEVLRKFVKAVG